MANGEDLFALRDRLGSPPAEGEGGTDEAGVRPPLGPLLGSREWAERGFEVGHRLAEVTLGEEHAAEGAGGERGELYVAEGGGRVEDLPVVADGLGIGAAVPVGAAHPVAHVGLPPSSARPPLSPDATPRQA
jgi:hypothetical protein